MKLNIKQLMDEKKISRYEMSQKIGVTYPTMTNLYNGTSSNIRLDNLEMICKILECTPNDIFIFEDNETVIEDFSFNAMNPPINE